MMDHPTLIVHLVPAKWLPLRAFCRAALLAVALAAGPVGCGASYATPGRGADLSAMGVAPAVVAQQTDGSVATALDRKPLAAFPAAVAVARIQAPGYRSRTAEGWGRGRYSIVTTRDVERDDVMARLAQLPLLAGVAPLNRLLLSDELHSDLQLRQAAAQLHADLLLVYTLDTTFVVEDKAAPLTVVTLGLSPNQRARVVCTASAVLLGTRNGYVYGVAEATDRDSQAASAWTSDSAVDDVRKRTEARAFEKLVTELERTWAGVIRTHAGPARAAIPVPPVEAAPAGAAAARGETYWTR